MQNNKTQEPKFTDKKALEFTNELWGKVKENGFGAWSKNDISDYLLYLFNKHGGGFFDKNSNEQNERLLKTTAAKIKASKKNISVKFMDDDEYKDIFISFLRDLSNGKIILKESEKENRLEFVLEDKVVRDILNAKLKDSVRDSLDYYNLNTEKVEINATSFYIMLKKEAGGDVNLDDIARECKTFKGGGKVEKFLMGVFGAVLNEFIKDLVAKLIAGTIL